MLIVAMVKDLFAPKGACLSSKLTARADRRFEFEKRRQLFIRAHNEALSVAMRVSNPDCSPLGING
jgi:hypothetical protein